MKSKVVNNSKTVAALTTEGLRKILFETIKDVRADKVTCHQAVTVAKLSEQMIKTADLEMRYTEHLERIDRNSSGISPGPMLLATE